MKRRIKAALAVLVLAGSTIVMTGESAMAGDNLNKSRALCGSGYSFVSGGSAPLNPEGDGAARVFLFYNSSSGYNCVVARKYDRHEIREPMRAGIRVAGNNWTFDPVSGFGNFLRHAGPVKQYGRGKCVQFHGYYSNRKDIASHREPAGRFCN